ncbi:uncharacterized protein LOC141851056 [Brevipalpus obovatus]|uniref:uncharacterized protein LOC141851056 n=1 Tax=Brevipalpus obovatus TaxID=246614 RepID=UPI003D9DDFB1
MQKSSLIFRQLFDRACCGYTYLLGDVSSKSAILIDPVLEQVDRDLTLIHELGLKLKYVVNTHVHADHITGSGSIKNKLTAIGESGVKSVISTSSGAKADIKLDDKEELIFGGNQLQAVYTPGHTDGCMSLVDHKNGLVFTGDTLFVRGCGRTDFQCGNSSLLYDSVHQRLFTLPLDYKVFPAHDYKGQTVTTIGEEKQFNPRLTKSRAEFIEIMSNLKLEYPKMMDIAVPKNMVCGF